MEELKALLENYFIIKDIDKELYYSIKDNYKKFKPFVKEKLGYELLMRGDFIKLEKIPGRAEGWMGIDDFDDKRQYVFLILLLIFLEDKNKEEQFLLSNLTEFIASNFINDKVDWTDYRTRRDLIKVIKFALNKRIIIVNDGEEEDFAKNDAAEVLYESTGLSKYMVRNFPIDIMKCKSYRDLEDENQDFISSDRGFLRKNRVYRRLVLSPVVYNEGSSDEDYVYIRNYRNIIEEDFSKYLNWQLHVHKNGAMAILSSKDRFKNVFPSKQGISDVVLHLNKKILNYIKKGIIQVQLNDIFILTKKNFLAIIKELKEEMSSGWSKEYRECSLNKLENDIKEYMKKFSMAVESKDMEEEILKIYPLIGKVIGDYPKDYIGGKAND